MLTSNPTQNAEKLTKDIRADVFIIPNPAVKFVGSMSQEMGSDLDFWSELNAIWWSLPEKIREGREFQKDEFIQVWYATPGNSESDWFHHGIDGYNELKGWHPRGCAYLPKCLFKGYKEGDCITIELPLKKRILKEDSETGFYTEMFRIQKVQLILSQLKHMYKYLGSFEEVLQKV